MLKKNNRFLLIFILSLFLYSTVSYGQWGGMGGMAGKGMGEKMKIGHYYGKVVDSVSGKGIEYAVVRLTGNVFDTTTKTMRKDALIAGQLTQSNGDFSLDSLPVMGKFTLTITAMGYQTSEQKLSFNINFEDMKKGGGGTGGMMSAMNAVDKDLGNIKMRVGTMLKEFTVESVTPIMEIKLDKKIFNVEKSMVTTGGTAEDVLKQVPAVNVDIDGNVTMRNAAPQIFVDGRPTTLTIDQIPADAIQSIEVISNPSAKYDASGGMAGILNIVLKKNRRIGYNGSVRIGVDQRGKVGGGGDLNAREGKFNFFISGMGMQRKSITDATTTRSNLVGVPLTNISQTDNNQMIGMFANIRGGFDLFLDNRNTFTVSQMYTRGQFDPLEVLNTRTDSLYTNDTTLFSTYQRHSNTHRLFNNLGSSLQYKHIFPKEGKELTADINYNKASFTNGGDFSTQYYNMDHLELSSPLLQHQSGAGANEFVTIQSDLINPINKKMKIEAGIRGALRNFSSENNNYIGDVLIKSQSTNYTYLDQVYAAYATFSHEIGKFSYQAGLRVESSFYEGELIDSAKKFKNQYPFSFFPSAFLTYHLSKKGDLQMSYSRRINRPGFFNLIPYTDYSDSLNLKKGNPDLRPEFTNSLELNYLHNFNRSDNMLISIYLKHSTDLITSFQSMEYDSALNRTVLISTSENANFSYAYGSELTIKKNVKKFLDLTGNINVYNSVINGTNLQSSLTNERLSWFAKMSASVKLPKNFSFQLSGNYFAQASLPVNSGGGGRWGMMGGMGGMGDGGGSNLQGYILPRYGMDVAVKKEFMKNRAASVTINFSDALGTMKHATHSENIYFIQDNSRQRDPQYVRVNFSYKFGKFDISLFKRKNTKVNTEDMGM